AAAIACSGATCEKKRSAPPDTTANAPLPDAGAEGVRGAASSSDPSAAFAHVPGLDAAQLSSSARRELTAVFTDEFCYCGCPHTLGACLAVHPNCRHARRMALLAAAEAKGGAASTEIINLLSRYYLSFRERARLHADPRLCLGKADARVTVIEFSDFECPYCAAAAPMLKAFAAESSARVCYAPYPLQNHPNAEPAARAALFARDHGKFWEMHDALFANQSSLSREKIVELGVRVGLDRARLQRAIESGQYADELRASREAAQSAGLDATPTVYVNGRKLHLSLSIDALRHTVEDELEWVANGGKWTED
ncbi:MAG TPA: thioredoxin domain-containing protein, partial [Myxococcaceae bacterium]|nr:thioredoxin domain-containing protein [Myxococcaceae bacterium]